MFSGYKKKDSEEKLQQNGQRIMKEKGKRVKVTKKIRQSQL